ncbi:TPA: hypothetical protein DIV45_02625 [Patescibacteria group bacterium]|nr:hypothetical protein [Patescibacteria group bacterium]
MVSLLIGVPTIVGVCGWLAEFGSIMVTETDWSCSLPASGKYFTTFIIVYGFLLIVAETFSIFSYAQPS